MSVIKRRVAVAANTVIENAIAGETFEFLRGQQPSTIKGGVVGSVVGIFYTFQVGDSVTVERTVANVETAANRGVNLREDLDILEMGLPGQRLKLRLENTTGGAIDAEFYFLIV